MVRIIRICSTTCGTGSQFRSRVCLNSNGDNNACPGPAAENRLCSTGLCPTWSEWTEFGDCDSLCGSGSQVFRLQISSIKFIDKNTE